MDFIIQFWKESTRLSKPALNKNFVKYAMQTKYTNDMKLLGKLLSEDLAIYKNYDTFLINKFVFENTFLIFWGSRTLFLDFWIFFVHVS